MHRSEVLRLALAIQPPPQLYMGGVHPKQSEMLQ
jgi:hypothetical protein